MPAAIATRGLTTFPFFGADAFLAPALAEQRHLSAVEVGLALTPATITWTIGAWVQARTTHRYTRRTMATAGVVLLAIGVVLTGAAVLVSAVPAWVAAAVWGVGGLGMGLSYSPTNLVVLTDAPEGTEGSATASVQLTDGLGTALGTGVGGTVVAAAASTGMEHQIERAHDRVHGDGRGRHARVFVTGTQVPGRSAGRRRGAAGRGAAARSI